MKDDGVGFAFDDIEDLLPPRATEYRSAVAAERGPTRDEPATVPLAVVPHTVPPLTVLPPAPGLAP